MVSPVSPTSPRSSTVASKSSPRAMEVVRKLSEEFNGWAGNYSPPTPRLHRQRSILHTLPHVLTRSLSISKRIKDTSRKSYFRNWTIEQFGKEVEEIVEAIKILMEHSFDFKQGVQWLIHWSKKDFDENHVLVVSSATVLACMVVPKEIIPKVRDRVFKSGVINTIIKTLVHSKFRLYPKIAEEELEEKVKIGSGAGGVIYQAKWNDKKVAVKYYARSGLFYSSEQEFLFEAAVTSMFGSFKNFMPYYGVNIDKAFVVMPLATKGSLENLISEKSEDLSYHEIVSIAHQIATSVRSLHRYGILHRDLKPANILLDHKLNCYLADFGISRPNTRGRSKTMNMGTTSHMAPEMIQGNGFYSESIDVFSYGIILWQILTRSPHPHPDISSFEVPDYITSGGRPAIPDDCPIFLANLITSCWHQEPDKRPPFIEIVSLLRHELQNISLNKTV